MWTECYNRKKEWGGRSGVRVGSCEECHGARGAPWCRSKSRGMSWTRNHVLSDLLPLALFGPAKGQQTSIWQSHYRTGSFHHPCPPQGHIHYLHHHHHHHQKWQSSLRAAAVISSSQSEQLGRGTMKEDMADFNKEKNIKVRIRMASRLARGWSQSNKKNQIIFLPLMALGNESPNEFIWSATGWFF